MAEKLTTCMHQHATQQHTLSLTSHYETLLANDSHQAESASLHASTSFSSSLAHLGGLVRLALREVEGEGVEPQDTDEGRDADPFEAEGYRVGSPSGIGPSEPAETGSTGQDSGRKSKAGYGSAPSRDPRWYGTGGYTGLQGDPEAEKAERALQARTEEERLRRENETLRELLRISADATPEIAREFGIEIAPPPTVATSWSSAGLNSGKLSLGKARGSRKSLVEAGATSKTAGEGLAEPEPAKGAVASKNSATKSASPEPLVPASPEAPVPLSLPPRSSSPVMAESAVSGLMSEDDPISPSKAAPQQGEGAGAGEPTQLMMSSDEVGKGKDASEAGASPANNGESAVMEDEEAAEAAKDTLAEDKAESADTGLGLRLEEGGVAEERPEATEVEEKAALRERILDEAEETLSETAKEGLLSP